MQKTLTVVLLLGLFYGCAVKASNPGPPPGKFTLRGSVTNMEDGAPAAEKLSLKDAKGKLVAQALANVGRYEFSGLSAGSYSLEVSGGVSNPLTLDGDVDHDVLLPRPAAPGRPRAYLGQGVLCVLWDDRSGIETAYQVTGGAAYELPAGAIGLRDARSHAALSVGLWVLAENEYGSSVSANADVSAYPPKDLLDRRLCRERPSTKTVLVITP